MFFRRNEGEFRETDRVTRFKLIKSGKNWLRAATSNFGLFKVVKGGADAPSVTVQNVEEKSSLLSGTALLKGIAAAGDNGICKINISSDIKVAFYTQCRKTLNENPGYREPLEIYPEAMEVCGKVVEEKIRLFKSNDKVKYYY